MSPLRRQITWLLCLLTAAVPVAGRHGDGAPAPPPPLVAGTSSVVLPVRWSWLHWWEANRYLYLKKPGQDAVNQTPDAGEIANLRQRACGVLMEALSKPNGEAFTAEAAMALGKMRHAPAVPGLEVLATKSNSARVRVAAITALGLMGGEDAEAALLRLDPAQLAERVANVASFGLAPKLAPTAVPRLRTAAVNTDPIISTAAFFALRMHEQEDAATYFQQVLATSESPWIAAEGLLALGKVNDDQSRLLLEDTVLGKVGVSRIRSWAELQRAQYDKSMAAARDLQNRAEYDRKYREYRAWYDTASKSDPNLGPPTERKVTKGGNIKFGIELIRLAWLRSSAAIALKDANDPAAGDALLRFVEEPSQQDEHLLAPKGVAIMSLTEYPSERSRDRFIALLGKTDKSGKLVIDTSRTSPLRGFAALALGLYARQYESEQGTADQPGYDWAIQTLAERLSDPREDMEVRNASALALGLTGRTVVVPILHKVTETLKDNAQDHTLLGFLLLGRSLAGDESFIPVAQKFLARKDEVNLSGMLARRAIVLALGVSQSTAAVPILARAWNLNYYVNRDVILALRLLGAHSAAAMVIDEIPKTKVDNERAFFACILGELFSDTQYPPLAQITIGSNYMVRNDQLKPLQTLANQFLFDYLIPSLGEQP